MTEIHQQKAQRPEIDQCLFWTLHVFQSTAPRSTWQRWQEEAWSLEPSEKASMSELKELQCTP